MSLVTPKKILLVGNSCWSMLQFRKELILHLQKLGHEVLVLAPPDETQTRLEQICKFYPLPMDRLSKSLSKERKHLKLFKSIYGAQAPDLVLQYTIKPILYGAQAAKQHGIPFINIWTGLGRYTKIKNKLYKWFISRLIQRSSVGAERIVFLNQSDMDFFIAQKLAAASLCAGFPGEGVDVDYYAYQPKQKDPAVVHFLFMGRVLSYKGIYHLIEALKQLHVEEISFQAHILGFVDAEDAESPSKETFSAWENQLPLRIYEARDDVRQLLYEMDCMVHPSYYGEGLSRAILEAGACGLSVICSDIPGCREIIHQPAGGYLVPPQDPTALAEAMKAFIHAAPNTIQAQRDYTRKLIEKEFATTKVLDCYDAMLATINF